MRGRTVDSAVGNHGSLPATRDGGIVVCSKPSGDVRGAVVACASRNLPRDTGARAIHFEGDAQKTLVKSPDRLSQVLRL